LPKVAPHVRDFPIAALCQRAYSDVRIGIVFLMAS